MADQDYEDGEPWESNRGRIDPEELDELRRHAERVSAPIADRLNLDEDGRRLVSDTIFETKKACVIAALRGEPGSGDLVFRHEVAADIIKAR